MTTEQTPSAQTPTPQSSDTSGASAPPAPETPPDSGVFTMPLPLALGYVLSSILIGLGAGLGQGFLSGSLAQMAGDLGTTTTEASWLIIAFIVPRCCMPILLTKVRTQYGLRRFTEVSVAVFVIADFAAMWMDDLRSAILVEILSGAASASLSTLAFLYMLEPLSAAWRLRLGLPVVMTALTIGTSLARVLAPPLIGDGGLFNLHLFSLGMAMMSLALVIVLPLKPVPHAKVIRVLDLFSFALITSGVTGIITGCIMGPIYWWFDAPWIGLLIAGGIAALITAVVIELHRAEPLLDIRWLASPAVVHLTGALLIFRIIMSEQSTGAPRLFQVLGLSPDQMAPLFAIIATATLLGSLACVAWLKPGREPQFHLIALVMIAFGAWMDSTATIDTRPQQMFISQGIIGFASMLFLPPALLAGLLSALRKGPQYILSFIVVFISTQSIGAMIGSGVFTTLINNRQAAHFHRLIEQMAGTHPEFAYQLAQRNTALAPQISDSLARSAQALSQITTEATNQAYVLAYNDAYYLTFLLAVTAASALCLHLFRDWLVAVIPRRVPTAAAATATPNAYDPK